MIPLDIINHLADSMGYATYLELGIRRAWENFDLVRVPLKHGVDINPNAGATFTMSSDDFFTQGNGLAQYDLIYVDADHRELPCLRDLAHAVALLSAGGTILCDNILPESPNAITCGNSGEAWKSFAYMRMSRPDLFMASVDIPFGLGVIRHGRQSLFVPDEAPYFAWSAEPPVDYAFYTRYRDRLMNVVSEAAFLSMVEGWVKE